MTMAPIVDAIRDAVPVPTGTVRQNGVREPVMYVAKRLYAWPGVEVRVEDGDGTIDRGDFTVSLAVTVLIPRETALGPNRAASLALDTAADDIATWVRGHRAQTSQPPLWEDLHVSRIDYAAARGFEYAGVRVDLAGYRYITS